MQIGIIGLGLLGGSIAKTLKKIHPQNSYIIGYDTEAAFTEAAFNEGMINQMATGIGEDFANCNVIFICTTVNLIPSIISKLLPYVASDCILTDIGSTKYEIVKSVYPLLQLADKRVHFIGGHPMAGSEKSGYFASTSYLFENAYYILTPSSDTPHFIVFILQKIVERLGAIPLVLPPSYHDFATATVSHVPHIIASSLVHLVKNNDGDNHYLHTLAAGGFKDITRIASSNPEVWKSICISNKKQILKILEKYITSLHTFYTSLESEDTTSLYDFFENARSYRDTFNDGINGGLVKTYTLYVDAKDEPGIIASIATLLSKNNINIKDIGIMNHREFSAGVLRISFENKSSMLEANQLLTKHNYTIYY